MRCVIKSERCLFHLLLSKKIELPSVRRMAMKHLHFHILFILLQCCSFSCSVKAVTINTDLFSIEIPDQWHVEDDKTGVILASGDKVVDKTMLPFLSIQYCAIGDAPKFEKFYKCTEASCSQESLDFLFSEKGFTLAPIKTRMNSDETVEYSTEGLIEYNNGSVLAYVRCGHSVQVYISMVSDQPLEVSRNMFSKIVRSLNLMNK